MTIWKTAPVTDVPSIRMDRWKIYEIGDDRHFVGWNLTEWEGRVSSKIEEFDPVTRRGRTSSGRIYELVGDPGYNADADYVWNRWKVINGVLDGQAVDVTTTVLEQA